MDNISSRWNRWSSELELPSGYSLVSSKPIGYGSTSTVYLIRKDDKLYVAKYDRRKLITKGAVARSMIKDMELCNYLRETLDNPVDTWLYPNIPVIIKNYISGSTLKMLIDNGSFFEESQYKNGIFCLLEKILKSSRVISDINPNNLIWDDTRSHPYDRWVIIDAKMDLEVSPVDSFIEKLGLQSSFKHYQIYRTMSQRLGYGLYIPEYNEDTYQKAVIFKHELLLTFGK